MPYRRRRPIHRLRHLLLAGGAIVAVACSSAANAGHRPDMKGAARDARQAEHALAANDAAAAIPLAERAVAVGSRDPGFRLTLGRSYLAAGRFVSARAALQDALTLVPANGRVALNLALACIATGDRAAALRLLDEHRATIRATDLGLATALAGDPASGVAILTAAVRAPDATEKTRQNLALALALSGNWQMARIVAAVDLPPAALDQRMQQWMLFADQHAPGDQVAALLGVTAIADPGQPIALALAGPVAVTASAAPPVVAAMPEAAVPRPVEAPALVAAAALPSVAIATPSAPSMSAPVAIPRIAPVAGAGMAGVAPPHAPMPSPPAAPVQPAAAATAAERIVFGPPSPVVQPLPTPAPTPRPAAAPVRNAAHGAGRWYVQLGAFGSAATAQAAWNHAGKRLPSLAAFDPIVSTGRGQGAVLHRLAVGGFDHGGAAQLCRRYRVAGGVCFIRTFAGEQLTRWLNRRPESAAS